MTLDWDRAQVLAREIDVRTAGDVGYVAKTTLGLALGEHAPRSYTLLPGATPQLRLVVGWRLPERLPVLSPPGASPAAYVAASRLALSPVHARSIVFTVGRYRVRSLCIAAIRLSRRAADGHRPVRNPDIRFPGLAYGNLHGEPDPSLRDLEAATWIWHRLARPGITPAQVGDEGEPRVRADRRVVQVRKVAPRSRASLSQARSLLGRHHVLDATIDVENPGALALLVLSRLGRPGFAGYGMVHLRRLPDHPESPGANADADWPSVQNLLAGRDLVPIAIAGCQAP